MPTCDPDAPYYPKLFEASGALLPARAVWERYHVTGRTLDRWVENRKLSFPQAISINNRRYFRLSELEDWERKQAAGRAARPRARRVPVDVTATRIA